MKEIFLKKHLRLQNVNREPWYEKVLKKEPNIKWRILTFDCMLYVIIMSHMSFRMIQHSIVCLNVKGCLARGRCYIWSLSDSNRIRTHNHLVCKQTLNHLAKQASLAICLSVPLRTKWLWVRIPLLSLDFLFFKISFLLGISTDAMFLGISGSLISTSFFFCNRLLC